MYHRQAAYKTKTNQRKIHDDCQEKYGSRASAAPAKERCHVRKHPSFQHVEQSQHPCGLPAPIAQGLMSHAYLAEMLTQFFGKNWLQGGKIDVKFIRYTLPGDVVTAGGVVKEKVEEGAAVRFNCDVWCESLSGEKTVVGTASCLVN
jgi:acyl dehydratase